MQVIQAYSLQVKSQDAAHTLGSQRVYISEIFKPYHLPRTVKRAKCVTYWSTIGLHTLLHTVTHFARFTLLGK